MALATIVALGTWVAACLERLVGRRSRAGDDAGMAGSAARQRADT
ncbi:hypothetical protein [Baekduia soli]|nr:hypothetical protein [Baekduia soli]